VNALIVAAGRSRRFGPANKLLARIGGRPLIVVSVSRVLAATQGPVTLVVGHDAHRIITALARHGLHAHRRLRIVRNRHPRAGMTASLDVALEAAPRLDSAVTLYLADMPNIAAGHDRALAGAVRAGWPVARVGAGHRPGHPVRLRRSAIAAHAKPGRLARTARACRHVTRVVAVPKHAILDVDTRQMIRALI